MTLGDGILRCLGRHVYCSIQPDRFDLFDNSPNLISFDLRVLMGLSSKTVRYRRFVECARQVEIAMASRAGKAVSVIVTTKLNGFTAIG